MQNCPYLSQARQCPIFTTICQVTRRWKKSSKKFLQPTPCFQVGCDFASVRQNMKSRRTHVCLCMGQPVLKMQTSNSKALIATTHMCRFVCPLHARSRYSADADKRRQYDLLGDAAVDMEAMDMEQMNLGTTLVAALFSSLGAPIPTVRRERL